MNYNLRLGNYLKAKNNTKNIIILNTLAILPLLIYFMINYKFNILIFIISALIYIIMEIIIKKITVAQENILIKDYYIYYGLINMIIIPYNIKLINLILINILSYLLYKILNKKINISLTIIIFLFLLIFKIDLSNTYLFINDITLSLLITYIIIIIYLYIIDYKINFAYLLTIFIYLITNSIINNNYLNIISILNPIYIILSFFIINDNNKLNPTSYGKNIIGIIIGIITIILSKLNINYYQIIALLLTCITYIFIDNYLIKYHFNYQVKKVSLILLTITILIISYI